MYKLLIEWLRYKLGLPDVSIKCETCEVLKLENANLRNEVRELLNHILNPKVESEQPRETNLKPILPNRSNWNSERMRLEREDAARNNELLKEKALKAAGQKDPPKEEQNREEATTITAPSVVLGVSKTIEELEKEFEVELPVIQDKVVGEN